MLLYSTLNAFSEYVELAHSMLNTMSKEIYSASIYRQLPIDAINMGYQKLESESFCNKFRNTPAILPGAGARGQVIAREAVRMYGSFFGSTFAHLSFGGYMGI